MEKRVAIIGNAFRFPQTDTKSFWHDLLDGKDFVTQVAPDRWSFDTFLHPDKRHPGTSYTFAAGSLGDVAGFDADFFGISPREAALMDPQQRLLLEMAWEAIENAGIVPSAIRGSDCCVFIGISSADYSYQLADDIALVDSSTATGNTASIAANRISYLFDLHGPSVAVDTACSSSLVAFHQACQSILSGESSMALTGGVSLHLHPYGFISFSKATMLSRKGRCQVFDADGDGYVRSEGGGMFLLKDLDLALRDGDQILATIAGTAVNTDGHKSGLTVPNPAIQAKLMSEVYQRAGISVDDIDYIEAHGTGTSVGDPIETRAIGDALGQHRKKPLPIGSVKSNIGHLEAASGIAGLTKALLSLQNRCVPATTSIKTPNPHIHFDEWNIRAVTDNLPLDPTKPLTIGVNSFGFGGANAHVILQSPPTPPRGGSRKIDQELPLTVFARTPQALRAAAADLAAFLEETEAPLYDIAYSALYRREKHALGAVTFASDRQTAAARLARFAATDGDDAADDVFTGERSAAPNGPAFVYSGNGCQWEGMGKGLLATSPTFRRAVKHVDRLFHKLAGYSLIEELKSINGIGRLARTEIAQPTLFAIQVGVTELLRENGVHPVAVTGHSVGEVAAAWAAGALPLDQAVKVIYHRSEAQGTTHGQGGMTAVGLNAEDMQSLLTELGLDGVTLAGINSHRGVTIAGDSDQLGSVEKLLAQRSVRFKRLPLDYAFHSTTMDPIRDSILEDLAELKTTSGNETAFVSTVTGGTLDGENLQADYWWRNIREPVRFQQAITRLLDDGIDSFIEIGAHPVLRGYMNDMLRDRNVEGNIISTLHRDDDRLERITECVARVVICDLQRGTSHWFPVTGQFVALPNYPWQRERHWHPATQESCGQLERRYVHPLLGSPVPHQSATWECNLDTQLQPWLGEHVVGEAVVFPGSGYVELAAAAALQRATADVIEIEDLEIRAPLTLGEQSKILRSRMDDSSGRLTIDSRDIATGEKWTTHAVARVLRQTRAYPLEAEAPVLPSRPADFDRDLHGRMTRQVGLQYGPGFLAIARGWVIDQTAVGLFDIPDKLPTDDTYLLHPALLDSAFQLTLQVMFNNGTYDENVTFVPVRVGRLYIRTDSATPHIARVELISRAPHSLNLRFSIFDDNGRAIAVLEEVRLRAIRLQMTHRQRVDFLDYRLVPTPRRALEPASSLADADIADMTMAIERAIDADDRYRDEIEPLLDSLAAAFSYELFAGLAGNEGFIDATGLPALLDPSPDNDRHLTYLVETGLSRGFLSREHHGLLFTPDDEHVDAATIWNLLLQDYPDYFQATHQTGRAGMQLHSVLDPGHDTVAAGAVVNPYGELIDATRSPGIKQSVHRSLSEFIVNAATDSTTLNQVRVLEIGAVHPSIAEGVLHQFDFDTCSYTFASTCPSAVARGETLRERYPLMESHRIPAEHDAVVANDFDIAIINLDFARLVDARQALDHARYHLGAGAPLLLLCQQPADWIDFTLGAAHGWWMDDGSSCQLTAEEWAAILEKSGFTDISRHGRNDTAGTSLLICRTPAADTVGPTLPRDESNWLIIAGENELESQLATSIELGLTAQGAAVSHVTAAQATDISTILRRADAHDMPYQHVIHVKGMAQQDSVDKQTTRCDLAAELVRACEANSTPIDCCLITHNVGTTLTGAEQAGFARAEQPPADTALWGFGRTLMNEASNYAVRMLDISGSLRAPAALDAVIAELLLPTQPELFIGSAGQQLIPRLQYAPAPETKVSDGEQPGDSRVALGFQLPGQLRHLQWQRVASRPLQADEVEVEVVATGLNFRDVMYALGMLSDEAIENGFAGPTLGLEFAGRVIRAGESVGGFSQGDRVVGFGPASFGNRTTVNASAIGIIPDEIGYEGAATIPSTFFTVYYALKQLAMVEPGEKLLIHGAAGGVGIAAIQIARWLGADIHATAGSDEKRDFLRLMGVRHVYDSRSLHFAEDILHATDGVGVDVVLNSLAGEAINQNLRVLKPFGRFLELGKRDFYENTHIGLRPFRNNISYFGIDADQLMQERPQLTQRLFREMMQLFADGELHPLPYTRFEANQIVEAFRYMQQARQIGKIVITYANGISAIAPQRTKAPELQLPANATYLVTGGLGGFGLRTARWLTEKGARHLVLLSRSGAKSDEAVKAVADLRADGIEVLASACDVTDRQALQEILTTIDETMPPLRGIVHAATVIEDGLARNLAREQIARVLQPKISGAINLHELTATRSLDFFVLYSSATTLFGNPGQSSYVAANHWLEGLAAHRRQHGLPATCVRWGAIDDVGFLARNSDIKDALQGRMGGNPTHSDLALSVLGQMLLADSGTLGVMDLEWAALARFLPTAEQEKFREIALGTEENGTADSDRLDWESMIDSMPDEELVEVVVNILKAELSSILLTPEDKIDANRSMYDMGLDSLMAVELMAAVEGRLGLQIPVMALSETPTLTRMAERLIGQMRGNDSNLEGDAEKIRQLRTAHGVDQMPDMDMAAKASSRTAIAKPGAIH